MSKVFLNLSPGTVNVTDVLDAIISVSPIESAIVMVPPDAAPQSIHEEFKKLLPNGIEVSDRKRLEFYAEAKSPDLALAIATGERRRFANIILTMGVLK